MKRRILRCWERKQLFLSRGEVRGDAGRTLLPGLIGMRAVVAIGPNLGSAVGSTAIALYPNVRAPGLPLTVQGRRRIKRRGSFR